MPERHGRIRRCPSGPGGARSPRSTSWRSWPPMMPPRTARRGPCCAVRACTPATSWRGDGLVPLADRPRWRRRVAVNPATSAMSRSLLCKPRSSDWSRSWPGAGQGPLRGGRAGKTARALGDALRERGHRAEVDTVTDAAITELAPQVGVRTACEVLGVAQAGYYRRHRQSPPPPRQAPIGHRGRHQPRALSEAERHAILEQLHSDRFVDVSASEVWATLLDEGVYLGSISTFYRLLRQAGENRERRRQATHPATVKPELVATEPNQVWSWDITKLRGPAKWTYYYLYVILDIFSRYVVGWMVAGRESAALAEVLIRQTIAKHGIRAEQLTIHADRGSSMTSKPVAFLL